MGILFCINLLIVVLVQVIVACKMKYYYYIPLYICVQVALYAVALYSCFKYDLKPASALILSSEMARTSMKMHAYFREKLVLGRGGPTEMGKYIPPYAAKIGVTEKDLDIPKITVEDLYTELKRYVYFYFAPTLVYRDEYVRNRKIRYQFLFKNILTFVTLVFYIWCVFKSLCIPIFKHTVDNPGSLRQFISSVIFSTVSGIICLLTLFYGVLHCWFNIFAELLRFGDRLFYEDWWTVTDFAGYYRKWNIVVHEFLYYYIYQDL